MRVGFNPVWLMSPRTRAEFLSPSDPLWLYGLWPAMTSVHGILQARILEWVAMLSSRASSWPKDENPCLLGFLHWQMGSLTLGPSGKPQWFYKHNKFRDRQLDRENGMWRWRCITQERGLERILPSGPQRKPTILTSWSQTSSLWTMKQLHFCLFKATQDGEHMYTHGWFMSMYGKNHYNIVK